MFIRKITQKKNGENYNSYRLVESIRTEKGPRQRVLLNLGADFNVSQDDWKILCGVLIEKLSKQPSIIQRVDTEFEVIADGIVKNILHKHAKTTLPKGKEEIANDEPPDYQVIDLNSLYHNDVRTVGGESLCLEMIHRLGLMDKLTELGFYGNQHSLAIGQVISRLLAPGSERSSFFWLKQQSSTGELIDFD
jgi:hypothetical protein